MRSETSLNRVLNCFDSLPLHSSLVPVPAGLLSAAAANEKAADMAQKSDYHTSSEDRGSNQTSPHVRLGKDGVGDKRRASSQLHSSAIINSCERELEESRK
jgi:hypothetical protein